MSLKVTYGGYRTTLRVSASPDRSLTGLVTGANAPGRGPGCPGWRSAWLRTCGNPTAPRQGGAAAQGVVTISSGDRKITTIALETFRNQDYHWVTPSRSLRTRP